MANRYDQLRDLLIHELSDLFDAEHQLLDALDHLALVARDPRLQELFHRHRQETEAQIRRLETTFGSLGEEAHRTACRGMEGLIAENRAVLRGDGDAVVGDLALIATAQRIEHYEIAAYGCARTIARMVGCDRAADELQESLDEERAADQNLNDLALALYPQTV